VTHNINIARTVPDNMGMLFRKHLVMFGPREVLLTSDEPVVRQFLNGRRIGPPCDTIRLQHKRRPLAFLQAIKDAIISWSIWFKSSCGSYIRVS